MSVEVPSGESPDRERALSSEHEQHSGLPPPKTAEEELLKELLELSGHDVEVAGTGAEGLEKARAFQPELVLCDIGLPEMTGYDVVRAMRADPALGRVRVIALTGYAGPEDVAKAKQAGFDGHVAKPLTMESLAKTLA